MKDALDHDSLGVAAKQIAGRDSRFAALVQDYGLVKPWWRDGGFDALVLMIIEQQISIASARATYGRLEARLGGITARAMFEAPEEAIRESGVTRQKTSYLKGLAKALIQDGLDLGGLGALPDSEALKVLTGLKGIGTWTAEVYLLTALRRADIFPAGDRALVVAANEFGFTRKELATAELAEFAESFSPWRSVLAWQLWHGYLERRGRPMPV